MQNFCLSEAIIERFQSVESELGFSEHIVKIDCNKIDSWEFQSRNSFEIESLESLAQSIIHKGQCQPIIVVKASDKFKPKDDLMAQYVVVAGHRRWMACKAHQIKVQAVIKDISFDQAMALSVADNERVNLSEFSKGMFYNNLIAHKSISELKLSKRLNIKLSDLNNYLAFAKVPSEIWTAVGDLTMVSARSAATILEIAKKGSIYVEALIAIAKHISNGYGEKRIQSAVKRYIDKKMKSSPKNKSHKHRIEFGGKIIINSNEGRIQLDKSLVNHGNYDELIAKLEKDVLEFANEHLRKN